MAGFNPVKLAYTKHEPSDGIPTTDTPVIFLHAFSVSKEAFGDIPQTVANETKRNVYAVDARNHGDSEWTDEFSFDITADDVLYFMDTVGEKKAILVGHSMGGITAMKAAVKKPEKIERIIIEDMYASRIPHEMVAFVTGILTNLRKIVDTIPPELNEEEAQQFAVDLAHKTQDALLKEYWKKQNHDVKHGYSFIMKRDTNGRYTHKANMEVLLKALKNPEELQQELAGKYDGPAYFICGKLSEMKVTNDADNIKRFFPKAEFVEIEKGTHGVHLDCPEEFMEALLKCLE